MEHIIGIDVASEVCAVTAMSSSGRVILQCMVETKANELKTVIKSVSKPRIVVFEECCQASWLYSIFEPLCDDIIVCNPKKNKDLSGHSKSDKSDSYNLAERARGGHLSRVWHGCEELHILRERLKLYEQLTKESTSLKNQIKAVFRSRGVSVGDAVYAADKRPELVKSLPFDALRQRVLCCGELLDEVSKRREKAKLALVEVARKHPRFDRLMEIPQIGEISAASIIATVGSAKRFRTRKQFWSYCGFAVVTHETGQFAVDEFGRIKQKDRKVRTRGLVRQYNRHLKYVFKNAAVKLCAQDWMEQYEKLRTKGVSVENSRLTIARKISAVALRILKTGEPYDEKLVFCSK